MAFISIMHEEELRKELSEIKSRISNIEDSLHSEEDLEAYEESLKEERTEKLIPLRDV